MPSQQVLVFLTDKNCLNVKSDAMVFSYDN